MTSLRGLSGPGTRGGRGHRFKSCIAQPSLINNLQDSSARAKLARPYPHALGEDRAR